MRIVVSTLEGKCLNSLRSEDKGDKTKKGAIELSVDPLDKDIRKDIVSKILAEYNKRLDNEQVTNTVKASNTVTSVKQSPVLKGHLFLVLS